MERKQVQSYLQALFVEELAGQQNVPERLAKHGLPQISVPKEVGKLLYLLVKISGSKRILEIGALGGYSTTWLARALPEKGSILSLELKEEHIQLAKQTVEDCNLSSKVNFRSGDAGENLAYLRDQGEKFDFVFIDADKPNYLKYLQMALEITNPGALLVTDNLLLNGRIFNDEDQNPSAVSVRMVNKWLAEEPRVESLLLPIGDGVGLARVKE
ncbi:O-methyltransferase [Risungbinella massiliensis]|uniref:O-methyltransferase n=1 Tax=Risungbinella massiliensis TaxID=1329796 RepID=UPI0005CBC679|nr:O-methyltransferase [Risungbinella massiliensis]